MVFNSKVYLARTGLQHDAFFRVRCIACRKAPLILADDGKSLVCKSCEHVIDTGTAITNGRHAHCSQCRAVAGVWSGAGLARCFPCHVAWKEKGRPEQTSRSVIRLRKKVALSSLIDTNIRHDFPALIAAYRSRREG